MSKLDKEIEEDRRIDKTVVKPLWAFINMAIAKIMKDTKGFKHFFIKMDEFTYGQIKLFRAKILYLIKTCYGEQYDFELYDDTREFCMIKSSF